MKKFKNNIDINPQLCGTEVKKDLIQNVRENNTYLPQNISFYDIDKAFYDFLDKELLLYNEEEKVRIIKIIGLKRFSDFVKSWESRQNDVNNANGKYRQLNFPFLTMVRKLDPNPGTEQGGFFNIPGKRTYSYYKVPVNRGNSHLGYDIYSIPQPTPVDLEYEVRLFCDSLLLQNDFNLLVNKAFNAIQHYIFVKGNPMSLILSDVEDESNLSDLNERQFYCQMYPIKCMGYIIDEKDFIVKPSIDRISIDASILIKKNQPIIKAIPCTENSTIGLNIVSKPFSDSVFSTTMNYSMNVLNLVLLENITDVFFTVNGVSKTIPFVINQGDTLGFTITKPNYLQGKLSVTGNLI